MLETALPFGKAAHSAAICSRSSGENVESGRQWYTIPEGDIYNTPIISVRCLSMPHRPEAGSENRAGDSASGRPAKRLVSAVQNRSCAIKNSRTSFRSLSVTGAKSNGFTAISGYRAGVCPAAYNRLQEPKAPPGTKTANSCTPTKSYRPNRSREREPVPKPK